jgi:hypothetical protein
MLFVDASADGVGFGTNSVSAGVHTIKLSGTDISGDTDGATIGAGAIVNLANFNGITTDNTIYLLCSTSANTLGQIASGIGFSRENSTTWGTQLRFYTHSTSVSDLDELNEQMRITSAGTVNIGTSNASGTSGNTGIGMTQIGRTISNCDTDWNYEIYGAQTGRLRFFTSAGGGTQVGSVTVSTSATSYNTSSDYRLKENVVELTSATERLKQLQPKRFNFIADADTTVDGFLAHEVSNVVPEAIHGVKDEVDAEGNPVHQGIDQSKLVPLLVATIKELEARITALENA